MKVTEQAHDTVFVNVPEALSVSSALAEGRDTGSPLSFSLSRDDAVRLGHALLEAVDG